MFLSLVYFSVVNAVRLWTLAYFAILRYPFAGVNIHVGMHGRIAGVIEFLGYANGALSGRVSIFTMT